MKFFLWTLLLLCFFGTSFLAREVQASTDFYVYGQNDYERNGIISLASTDGPIVNISINEKSYPTGVTVDIYDSNAQQLLDFLRHSNENQQISTSVDTTDLTKLGSIAIENSSEKLDLPIEETGIFLLHVHSGEKSLYTFVVRSSTGTVVKEMKDSLVFWTQDFQTKRSVSGANITLYDLEGNVQRKDSIISGKDGIALSGISQEYDVALVEHQGSIAILPINLRYLNYGGGSYSIFSENTPGNKAFLFTDRPVYQPGNTVFFKSILREDDDALYTFPDESFRVELYSGWGDSREVVFTKTYRPSEGSLDGEIAIPQNIETGSYTLSVYEGDEEYYVTGVSIQIEYYKKPEFGVDVTVKNEFEIISGEDIEVGISGAYFSGQPFEDGNVSYTIREFSYYDSTFWREDKRLDYYRYGYFSGNSVQEGKEKLDKNGKAFLKISSSWGATETKIYTIEIVVEDEFGNSAVESRNILVRPANFGIYRKDRNYGGKVGEERSIGIELHAFEDEVSLSNRKLTVQGDVSWWEKKIDNSGIWEKSYSYERHQELMDTQEIRTDKQGVALFRFTPGRSGSYSFLVSGLDDEKRKVTKEFSVWVSDRDGYYISGEQERGLTIQSKSEIYAPGERGEFTIGSDIEQRDVFVVFEREYVHRYKVVSLNDGSFDFQEDIVERDMPNIFVNVSSFNNFSLAESSKEIEVSTKSKELDISITPNKKEFEPGEEVNFILQVKDYQGNPVQTELTFWAVDKAIFELADPDALDIFNTFWRKRYNGTSDAHSLMGIGIHMAEMGGCFTKDTQVTMADGTRKNIQDIVPGDLILTKQSASNNTLVSAKVSDIHSSRSEGYLIVNSGALRVTGNHILFVNNTWKRADALRIGDTLLTEDGENVTVHSLEWYSDPGEVFNIEVKEKHSYFANNIYVHNGKGGGRSVFEDTAYWNPSIQTDADGVANISFALPDNLTTWAVAAVGATKGTQVGKSTNEIIVTKDVIVRPQLPRVFYLDDTLVVSALVQNFSDKKRTFRVAFESEEGEIQNPERKITLEKDSFEYIDWEMQPTVENEEGQMVFSAYDISDETIGDKITEVLPVRRQGYREIESFVGEGSSTYPIFLDEDIDTQKSSITLNIASTLVGSLAPAMEYLVRYPYGCMEQTTSRFVPGVIAKENPTLYGEILEAKDVDDMILEGVKRLKEKQNFDGGWGWWGGNSDPFVSVYVAEYIKRAVDVGIQVDKSVLEKARGYFEAGTIQNTDERHDTFTQRVLYAYGKSLFGIQQDQIIDFPESITPDILSYAVMANISNGYTNPSENGMERLRALLQYEGNSAYWEAGDALRFGSSDVSTGIGLRAFIQGGGDKETLYAIVRYLTQSRNKTYWGNTFATAQVVEGLTQYALLERLSSQSSSYEVIVNGEIIEKGLLNNTNQFDTVEIPLTNTLGKNSTLEVRSQEGDNSLFSSLETSLYKTDVGASEESRGIVLERTYTNTKGGAHSIGVGDIVDVVIEVSGSGMNLEDPYLIIEDQLPSGLIPVNTNLKNERQNQSQNNRFNWWGEEVKEFTENGAIISYQGYPKNKRVFTYKARAVNSGDFTAPPVVASLMYQPEVYGRAVSQDIRIDKESVYTLPPFLADMEKSGTKTFSKSSWFVVVLSMLLFVIFLAIVGRIIWSVWQKKMTKKSLQIEESVHNKEE